MRHSFLQAVSLDDRNLRHVLQGGLWSPGLGIDARPHLGVSRDENRGHQPLIPGDPGAQNPESHCGHEQEALNPLGLAQWLQGFPQVSWGEGLTRFEECYPLLRRQQGQDWSGAGVLSGPTTLIQESESDLRGPALEPRRLNFHAILAPF